MAAIDIAAQARAPHLHASGDPNLAWNRAFWARYEWPQDGDEWSACFGGTQALWYGVIRPRIRAFTPCRRLLEIAPGHGRCTQFLRRMCRRLTIVDLVPECIEACRRRFGADPRITYAVNDGRSLPMVDDESVDMAFSWDSLVHVEHATMRAYVHELSRVLRPGGYAFLHHSNLGEYHGRLGPYDHGTDLHGRGLTMTAAKLREDCRAAGLRVVGQELIPWGQTGLFTDAFSLIVNTPPPMRGGEPTVVERPDWGMEVENLRRMARVYRRVTPA